MAPFLLRLAATLSLAMGLSGCGDHGPSPPDRTIGLATSLPIVWRETGEMAELLDSDASPHWARAVIEKYGKLQPLDSLSPEGGALPLEKEALLILAQPRPLSPEENVALDDWVRAGGRVLLFADPMLTAESGFPLGDPRRSEDIVLLSPILARWGIQLQFEEDQPLGERDVPLLGGTIPVNLAGRFVPLREDTGCVFDEGAHLSVHCKIGEGAVLAIADAALFEDSASDRIALRKEILEHLISTIFGNN